MTCLMQGCEVGHSRVTTGADSVSTRTLQAIKNPLKEWGKQED